MADPRVNVILGARDEASKVVSGLRGQFTEFGAQAKTGFGMPQMALSWAAGAVAIGTVTAVLGDAVKMAIEEQENIAKLNTALRANIAGWDGNTAAIERTISARESLAFSDDDLRNSLAQLVVVTKNVDDALRIQATAMDLARLKNMSLVDASTMLGKAWTGNTTALRKMGIAVRAGASGTEALLDVQKAAEGQAAAYADTTGGKLATAQIRLNDAMEELGLVLVPIVTSLADLANTILPTLVGWMKDLNEAYGQQSPAVQGLIDKLEEVAKRHQEAAQSTEEHGGAVIDLGADFRDLAKDIDRSFRFTHEWTSEMARARHAVLHETMKLGPSMRDAIEASKKEVRGAMQDLRWAVEHPFAGDSYTRFLERKQRQANRLLVRAIRDGNRDGAAEANAMVNAIRTELLRLAGFDFTIATSVAATFAIPGIGGAIEAGIGTRARQPRPHPKGGRHGKGKNSAMGGTYWPGDWGMVGENEPERIRNVGGVAVIEPTGHGRGHGGGHGHDIYLDGERVGRAVDRRLGDRWATSGTGAQYRSS